MKQFILILFTTLVTMCSCLGKVEQMTRDTDVVKVGQKLPQFSVKTVESLHSLPATTGNTGKKLYIINEKTE